MDNILKRALKRDLKASAELVLRELDQHPKGTFIAFVDQGMDSWDVKVTLDQQKVVFSSCDCHDTKKYCIHQLALIQYLSNNRAVISQASQDKGVDIELKSALKKGSKTKKQKLTPTQELLQNMDKGVLQQWILEVFKKNKPLEQQFLLSFSSKELSYTPEMVREIAMETILSVRGKRKTLEAMKIKKVVDLLQIAIEPINAYMVSHIDSTIAYTLFCTFLDTVYDFDKSIVHHSKRLGVFVDKYIEIYALWVHQIKDPLVYKQQIEFYLSQVFVKEYRLVKQHTFILVQQLFLQGTAKQNTIFTNALIQELEKHMGQKYYFKGEFSSFLMQVCKNHKDWDKVKDFFNKQYFFSP